MCLLFASVVGCGSQNPYGTVPASGKITYQDGSLIPAARIDIEFISQNPPIDAKTHPRPGVALVEPSDGSFVVSTYEFGDGLIQGRHKVTVSAYDEKRNRVKGVPASYADPATTPLEVDTASGQFDLLIERATAR
jgi:hypothetical protein